MTTKIIFIITKNNSHPLCFVSRSKLDKAKPHMLDLGVYNKSNMNNLANIFEKIDAVKWRIKKYQS